MLATTSRLSGPRRRRGIVLVLILAMLGLLALIGVTFATFAGQAQLGARSYAQKMNQPDPEKVFDFALAQLIYDTDNPTSALHGHSLARDMYGNDSHNQGILAYLPGSGLQLQIQSVQNPSNYVPATCQDVLTNIPASGNATLYGANYTRWTMRLDSAYTGAGYLSAQTFEVILDTVVNGYHVFTIPFGDASANLQQPINLPTFTLDGRYQRAFNGPGLSPIQYSISGYNYTAAMFGNFLWGQAAVLLGGFPTRFSPDIIGMDEDYDAVDTENWFLAAQNADGTVNIPSFHRPGLLTANDWANSTTDTALDRAVKRAKILRPRKADHPASGNSFPDLVPDANGKIEYDVDNDGDGVTDAVWLDLGYPAQRDSSGKLYKPLFAISVVGLNGRLPLNTVGNLNSRRNTVSADAVTAGINDIGAPTLNHASHLGYTPSEINPKYAFAGSDGSLGVNQLRKLLQGILDANGNPIDGRWGEADQLVLASASNGSVPFPRPGRSRNLGGSDDSFDSLDIYSNPAIGWPESGNLLDAAGALMLPVERQRLGVTPFDPTGNGFLVDWKNNPTGLARAPGGYGAGFDQYGRVGYYMYYRPPGRPLSVPNTLHSWEAMRYPPDYSPADLPPPPADPTRQFWGTMPFNNGDSDGNPLISGSGTGAYFNPLVTPSFVVDSNGVDINSQVPPQATNPRGVVDPTVTYGLYPGWVLDATPGDATTAYSSQNGAGSLMRDDPTEVNLYKPNQLDEIFSYPDLEWLYRVQDVDGKSLQSRLASLLPDAFVSPADGLARQRRLQFSLESWETNDFAWTNDNPGGAFPYNTRFVNSSANASFRRLGMLTSFTPPLASRGRKINLNMPLPPSHSPTEPTRIKWINNAYAMFKTALPPKATDTPEELAAIGQFCVNIIDFRDPDDAITVWTNPDVRQIPATPTSYSKLAFGSGLVQYGMEYPAVAINEALAYSFQRIKIPNTTTSAVAFNSRRLMVELINMNTEDRGLNNDGTAADLKLKGWEIVVLPDNSPANRPDPITGQISSSVTLTHAPATPGTSFTNAYLTPPDPVTGPRDLPTPIPALNESGPNGSSYYVVGYNPVNPGDDTTPAPFTINSLLEGTADDLLPTVGPNQYIWIYLRRPANPNSMAGLDTPANPHVVVDSIRIPLCESGGTYQGYNTMTSKYMVTQGTQPLYSTERLQPYRGGQAVPLSQAGATAITNALVPRNAYGYSEQTKACVDTTRPFNGYFNSQATSTGPVTQQITNTMGRRNDSDPPNGDAIDTNWSPLVFHDRDFMSVAELLLVPGCSPGLFTKQFVERGGPIYPADPASPAGTFPYVTPPTTRPSNATNAQYDYLAGTNPSRGQYAGLPLNPSLNPGFTPLPVSLELPTFPYLPDNFYYTAASESYLTTDSMGNPITVYDLNGANTAPDPVTDIGGQNGAGWHRALEFFEVPSTMIGAIGTVADGENRDWLRQDLRPGQLNINLIFDESVYQGLMDDPRLNVLHPPTFDFDDSTNNPTFNFQPRVVTQVNANGYPTKWSKMNVNYGSFSDFLKLRHGGSGFLFAFGGGGAGSGAAVHDPVDPADPAVESQSVAVERPFRSLSYPDIKYTILRPATIEPTLLAPVYPAAGSVTLTAPQAMAVAPLLADIKNDTTPFPGAAYWGDPSLKNPFLSRYLQDTDSTRSQFAEAASRPTSVVQPPPIPPRRMFELPDFFDPTTAPPEHPGNASESGDPRINTPTTSQSLNIVNMDLFQPDPPVSALPTSVKLGIAPVDLRRHPLYRTELLQKLMNLTTVRTHQYAVWVTVGFFEVVKPGNPQLSSPDLTLPPAQQLQVLNASIDQLGPEVGLAHGSNVRYRSFFIVDRTRATGFDPSEPGDFRKLIVHRRRIE